MRPRWLGGFLKIVGVCLAYLLPLFWLWNAVGYPEAFGVEVATHGKAALFDLWRHSFRLLDRGESLDLVTFAYMWLAVAGPVLWFVWICLTSRQSGSHSKRDD